MYHIFYAVYCTLCIYWFRCGYVTVAPHCAWLGQLVSSALSGGRFSDGRERHFLGVHYGHRSIELLPIGGV